MRIPRIVPVATGGPIFETVIPPSQGGNGEFAIHANAGYLSSTSVLAVPFDIGVACFPVFYPTATPIAIWGNLGRTNKIGESTGLDGQPIYNPDRAPTFLFHMSQVDPGILPDGSRIPLQGIIVDPGSSTTRGVSVTNAVLVEIVH